MRMLVTGASGSVGSLLVPRLIADGHSVRTLGREPSRVSQALARTGETAGDVEILSGDVLMGTGLDRALADVEVAYYLIHSMESVPSSASFADRERIAAQNFAAAASRTGVRRIVYLGGLLPRWSGENGKPGSPMGEGSSRHLSSRIEVEEILLGAVEDSVALRASIVIGARSRSFRLLVRLVERLPVLTLPAWRRFRTQPIDARDITAMLTAAADAALPERSLEVGGPDILTYGDMLTQIAELMLISRPALGLGVNLTPVAARVAAAVAGEDPALVLPLMEGLRGDLLPEGSDAAELLDVRLHSFDSAVEHALGEWELSEPLSAR
jgi:uncharacterized protein YbjT (DUF2867 family)